MTWWKQTQEEQDKSFELLEGVYTAQLENASSEVFNNMPQLKLTWRIVGPTNTNRKVFQNLNFMESAAKYLKWQFDVLHIQKFLNEANSYTEYINIANEKVFQLTKEGAIVELKLSIQQYADKTGEAKTKQAVVINKLLKGLDVSPLTENNTIVDAIDFNANEDIPF